MPCTFHGRTDTNGTQSNLTSNATKCTEISWNDNLLSHLPLCAPPLVKLLTRPLYHLKYGRGKTYPELFAGGLLAFKWAYVDRFRHWWQFWGFC